MGNLTDLAGILKVDPAYLGAVLCTRGMTINREGNADLNRALSLFAKNPDVLEVAPLQRPNDMPASAVPVPPVVERVTKIKEHKEKQKRIGFSNARRMVLSLLQKNGIEAAYEEDDMHCQWLLVGSGQLAYASSRKFRKGRRSIDVYIPTARKEWAFLILMVILEGEEGHTMGTNLLVLTYEESMKHLGEIGKDRNKITVPYDGKYFLVNRKDVIK